MRRSVSARIFASFLVVMLAFSGVIGYTVYRMDRVRRELELIGTCYLRLTLVLGELHTVQRNLLETLADRAAGRGVSRFVRRQVNLASQFRLHEVRRALQLIERTDGLDVWRADRAMLQRLRGQLGELFEGFERHAPVIASLFEADAPGVDEVAQILRDVQLRERGATATVQALRDELRRHLMNAAAQVSADQRYGVTAGIVLVILALLSSVTMTWRARQTLRPLKTLVEGAKRIGSGDLAQRVPVASADELGMLAGEFNKMAEAIQEREQRLLQSERMAAAGMLASHITHEVRNPLNSISLNTEMLEEELGGDSGASAPEARALCGAIRKEVDRLTEITEEYLRFARLPKPCLQPEDANEVVGSLLAFMAEELRSQDITLERRLAPGALEVMADENQLRQALLNLLRNAAEALAGAGGGTLSVTSEVDSGGVTLAISDTGPGMEPERVPHIFEPFFSTKEHGTGLGLAITRRIVEEHGGSISVRSRPGQGTTFCVVLPRRDRRDTMG